MTAAWLSTLAGARFLVALAVLLSPLWGHVLAVRLDRRKHYGRHAASATHPAYAKPIRRRGAHGRNAR